MFRGGAKDSDTAGWLDEMVEVYLHVDGFMKVHACMNFNPVSKHMSFHCEMLYIRKTKPRVLPK